MTVATLHQHEGEQEVFVGVVRPNGKARFHRQDCAHALRAKRTQWYLASDFAPGDAWCSACCSDLRRPSPTSPTAHTGDPR